MIQRWWFRIAPYWHVMTGVTLLIVAIIIKGNSVMGYDGRISALETAQTRNEKVTTRMDYNIQIIAHKVGVQPLVKAPDE